MVGLAFEVENSRKFYWWKCQHCGFLIQRCTKGEPRGCPLCRDRGCKDFRGYCHDQPGAAKRK